MSSLLASSEEKGGALSKDAVNTVKADAEQTHDQECQYTAFSTTEQRTVITLVALATLASPLTANLYLPLVPPLAAHFSVSIQAINLTITVYIIFQAIAPLLLSTHSDSFGRRPVFLVSFSIYTVASLGLALNRHSYAALMTLRALQSLGSSSILSISYGVVADLRPSSTRGKALGPLLTCGNLGGAIGPLLGGAIAYSGRGLWWAFWTMLCFSGSMLLALAFLLPETARKVVGEGSLQDRNWNRSFLDLLRGKCAANHEHEVNVQQRVGTRKLNFKSPLQAVFLMRHPETALILWIIGSFYALWYTIQVSIPVVFEAAPYHFNELEIGLSYLPGATGVLVCMYATGRAMDRNYRVLANTLRHETESGKQGKVEQINTRDAAKDEPYDITHFPIELARSRYCLALTLVSLALTIGYGWVVQTRLHPAIPLILQFFLGFLATWILNMFNALLVDIYPDSPSTAATAGNLIRCGFSAAAVAALHPLTSVTNIGWFFTIAGLASGALGFAAVATVNHYGMRLRQKRSKQGQARAS